MSTDRVLFMLGTTGAGGAENQCLYLLEALRGRGIDVELAYFHQGRQHERFASLNIPLHPIPSRSSLMLDWHSRARAIRRRFASEHPMVLHTWLYEAHDVGLVAARAWPKTKVVLSHRSSTLHLGARKHILALRALRGRIDHVVANSSAGADMIVQQVRVEPARVSVISNGIPLSRVVVWQGRAEIRSQLSTGSDTPVICSVGRFDRQRVKDRSALLRAMSTVWSVFGEAELVIVGVTASELRAEIGGPIPPRVTAVGWQPRAVDWMNAADVVAVHSRTEGHSNVADEALLLGRPVVATDTGDHPALVRRAGGRVAPVGRDDLLGEAILELIRHPPPRQEVSAAAREALSIDAVASAFIETYEGLTGRRSTAVETQADLRRDPVDRAR